jgi:hypothetical protein
MLFSIENSNMIKQMGEAGRPGALLIALTGVAGSDSGPELGLLNCFGKDLFARQRIAVNQERSPRPGNIPIAPSIWANGHYAPAPVE